MPDGLAIFTICSNNYVPMASVFLDSARRHHPEAALHLCLADTLLDGLDYPQGCTLTEARDLGVPDFSAFAFRYDVMEFNTALKPFMIRRLLAQGYRSVLYFDPDIEIFRPLTEITDALAAGAPAVLTPHLCAPSEHGAFPDDTGIMRAGIYNLGFLGVGAGQAAEALLRWWSRRLEYQCVNDQPNGIFVDQKFIDLVPGFADGVAILRHPALNVAYWNLPQRLLARERGQWLVDGRPLGFFHYSGFAPANLAKLSKYTDAFTGGQIPPDLLALMQHYASHLHAAGYGGVPGGSYAYGHFRSGTPVTPIVRRIFREDHPYWHDDPFDSFEDYLSLPAAEPWAGPGSASVTNLVRAVWKREPWLQATYRPDRPGDGRGLADWFVKHAGPVVGDERLVEPVAGRLARSRPLRLPPPRRTEDEPDLDVVGYLRLALGLGEAGRLTLRSLRGAGLRVRGVAIALNSQSSCGDDSCVPLLAEESRARVQVFAVNADQLGQVIDQLGRALRQDSYRIATPFWELARLPDAWAPAFDLVDEVWAPTRFIHAMLTRATARPVVYMPPMLDFDPPPAAARDRFGLPNDRFLFFFAFDYFSFMDRKNPAAVVAAFRRAFRHAGGADRAALVLKTLNAEIVPEQGRALRDGLADDPDVIMIEQTLSRQDTLALIAACDAVVSLHRSEGLGLLVAEAMALGKPVISTDYSGTTDLVTPQTGYPVDFTLVAVQEGQYPFATGQVWAEADIGHAAWQMRQVFRGGPPVERRVAAARAHLHDEYGPDTVARRQLARLRAIGMG